MRRDLLLVLLLVLLPAMGVGQTDKKPEAENPSVAASPQVKTEAVPAQKQAAQVKTKAQKGTAKAQAEKKKAQGQTETAQVKTEAAPGQKQEAPAEKKNAQGQTETQTEAAQAQTEEPQADTDQDPKLTSVPGGKALGMSVLGNQEAPTSLVIVPWKSSEVGRATGISPMLDDSRQPVDKEVFMRELRYYEIRSEKKQ